MGRKRVIVHIEYSTLGDSTTERKNINILIWGKAMYLHWT